MASPNTGHQTEKPDRSSSVFYLLRVMHSPGKLKLLAVTGWLGYWLLYAFSGGIFFYYPNFDLTPYIKGLPNPEFVSNGPYSSGFLWWPNGHLQVNLLYGPFIFSLVLSTLFSLNLVLTLFSIRFAHFSRGMGPVGILALIPALFSGGCCSVPLGLSFVGTFAPTVGLTTLVYNYPYLTNVTFLILMLFSLVYTGRRLVKIMNSPPGSDRET